MVAPLAELSGLAFEVSEIDRLQIFAFKMSETHSK